MIWVYSLFWWICIEGTSMVKNQIEITSYYIFPQVFVVCSGYNKHVLRSILWVWLLEPLRLDSPLGPLHHLLVLWEVLSLSYRQSEIQLQVSLSPDLGSQLNFLCSTTYKSSLSPQVVLACFSDNSDNVGISHSARGPIISSQIFGAMVPFLHETLRLNPIMTVFPLNLKHHHMIIAFRQSVTWTIGIEAKNLISFKNWKKNGGGVATSDLWSMHF